MSSPDRPRTEIDPAARPRSLAQRLQLLVILLILPGLAVAVPAFVVTRYFGQRPPPKIPAHASPAPSPDTSGLTAALEHSAQSLLPTPAPLTPEPIRLTVQTGHLAARAEKVALQAKTLGGSAVEGVAPTGEKHLFVDLPAGRADAFRRAVTANDAPVVTDATPVPGAARDQLEVLIRNAAADE